MRPGGPENLRDRLFLMRISEDGRFDTADIVDYYHYWDEDTLTGIGRKRWYYVVIDVRGNHITVDFGRPDDEGMVYDVIDWYDTHGAWESGTVGFATYATTARFDYIRVLPLY